MSDDPCPEDVMDLLDGAQLDITEQYMVAFRWKQNHMSWEQSQKAREALDLFRSKYGHREGMRRFIEWGQELTDEDGNRAPIEASTLRKMVKTASLPAWDSIIGLTLSDRARIVSAMSQGATLDDAVSDMLVLSRADFECKWLHKSKRIEKPACVCPSCGGVHAKKEGKV